MGLECDSLTQFLFSILVTTGGSWKGGCLSSKLVQRLGFYIQIYFSLTKKQLLEIICIQGLQCEFLIYTYVVK